MKTSLLKTNLCISIVLIIGFALTAVLSYQANYRSSLDNIEQVSALTADGIYYQLLQTFTQPVNVSLAMARDSLLVDHLSQEGTHLEDGDYIQTTARYLSNYQQKYGFDSVFLVSSATGRYYNFNGLDRVLTRGEAENTWYFSLLDSGQEYAINVDNDEVVNAENQITVFVNCKVHNQAGELLGVVGAGIRIDGLAALLGGYEQSYDVSASLIDQSGVIQISSTYNGYDAVDWFDVYGHQAVRGRLLAWTDETRNLSQWSSTDSGDRQRSYIVSRYIPELSWHLVVQQDTGALIAAIRMELLCTATILVAVIVVVLLFITTIIRSFNRQITKLMEDRQAIFQTATEQQYDNIYELNLTRNCTVGRRTQEYFESLGAKDLPLDQGLRVIAQKQIKGEYREGYLTTFSPENAIRQFQAGNHHLCYDFEITQDGESYFWMRIDAYIFRSPEDNSIHMFTYRKNIDKIKRQELQALTDEMTGLYTKTATQRAITQRLAQQPQRPFAFFIFDIDNFKQANDRFGHAFGDLCIHTFTSILRSRFREGDVLGRVGGDEFVAFIPVSDPAMAREKAGELSAALCTVCSDGVSSWSMSASIGVSLSPQCGTEFSALYQSADDALYQTKKRGKNGYTIAGQAPSSRPNFPTAPMPQ